MKAFGGYEIEVKGEIKFTCAANNIVKSYKFIVVKEKPGVMPILRREACEELNFIKRVAEIKNSTIFSQTIVNYDVLKNYKNVFSGVGKFPEAYSLKLKKDVQPIARPAHRVAQKLKKRTSLKKYRSQLNGLQILTLSKNPTIPIEFVLMLKI